MMIKIEQFFKDKPIQFWIVRGLVSAALASIPIIFWQKIKLLLLQQISMPLYLLILIVFLILTLYIVLKSFLRNGFKIEILKELYALKAQLDEPFEHEEVGPLPNQKRVKKYYHYEILECFDDYNSIIERLKNKRPKKYNSFKTVAERPKIPKGDWVYESEMQGVKSKVLKLLEILKG